MGPDSTAAMEKQIGTAPYADKVYVRAHNNVSYYIAAWPKKEGYVIAAFDSIRNVTQGITLHRPMEVTSDPLPDYIMKHLESVPKKSSTYSLLAKSYANAFPTHAVYGPVDESNMKTIREGLKVIEPNPEPGSRENQPSQ